MQGGLQDKNQIVQNYSLDADMVTGWKPKMKIIGPMPLNFDNPYLDRLIKPLIHSDTSPHEVIYLGLRPRDTFQMHSQLSKNYRYKFRHLFTSDYSHLKPFFRKFYSEFQPQCKMPFNGMNPKISSNIVFQSRFQSGNLDCVVRSKSNQYDLFLRIDSNTCGHVMWFYFKVKNCLEKSRTIRLNICNLRKTKAIYDKCLQPYVCRQGTGWKQESNNLQITQDRVRFYRQHLIFSNAQPIDPISYRKMSFDLNLKANQEVQVAYSIPYTYSQLLEDIKYMRSAIHENQNIKFDVDMSNISLSGLEIPYIKISSKNGSIQQTKKQGIFIIGRQHPGQSVGSHVLKGFMTDLISNKNKQIHNLLNRFIFHIVPMVNPDGVVIGNFRTSLYGKDLNRLFRKNETLMIPEVEFCKNLVFQITKKKKKRMFMFLDFHGHSSKRNCFCYAPGFFQTNSSQDIRQMPRIISQITQMFRFPSCSFRISNHKKTTARAVFCGDANLCYTIQTSNWSYYSRKEKNNILFDVGILLDLGSFILKGLGLFYDNISQRKAKRKRLLEADKLDNQTSNLLKNKMQKKIHIKTHENLEQMDKSITFVKKNPISSNALTQKILPSSTRSVQLKKQRIRSQLNQFQIKDKNQLKKSQIKGKYEEQQQLDQDPDQQLEDSGQDSDQSENQDMQKQKFKKYINVASKMFIEFEKAYYGEQYHIKGGRYQLPKKISKKKQIKQIPIIQQACLRKNDKKTLQSQKSLIKIGQSQQKIRILSKLKMLEEKKKPNFGLKQLEIFSKQDIIKSLPKINVVNYIALQDIDDKPVFKIPKISSLHIKNAKKV